MSSLLSISLRNQQHPLINQWANQIETVWRHHLDLSPYTLPKDLGYIEGHLEGEALVIVNRCYQSPQFRKLHLELARVGAGVDILHCVMFPRPNYALPLFGTDIVGNPRNITAAIADLSPSNSDRTLPETYQQHLSALPSLEFDQPRTLPEWGTIFSEFCLFVRPMNDAEQARFLERATAYLRLHCQQAIAAQPVTAAEQAKILAGQRHYCQQQQRNDKTRRILEKAFGAEWADCYMKTVLFDLPEDCLNL